MKRSFIESWSIIMVSFREHLDKVTRQNKYRIKIVGIDINDDVVEHLKQLLYSYDILTVTINKDSKINHPFDFKTIDTSFINIIDITTKIPFSPYYIQHELLAMLKLPESYVIIRTWEDPREIDTRKIIANKELNAEMKKDGITPMAIVAVDQKLSNTTEIDCQDLHGPKQVQSLLDYLVDIEKNRMENALNPYSSSYYSPEKKDTSSFTFNGDIYKFILPYGSISSDLYKETKVGRDANGKIVTKTKSLK